MVLEAKSMIDILSVSNLFISNMNLFFNYYRKSNNNWITIWKLLPTSKRKRTLSNIINKKNNEERPSETKIEWQD